MPRTRLAPSPTGALHLGNARTFLINWAIARQHDWQIVLRIDDLDGPRIKRGAEREAVDVLTWLGLDWDEGPFYQSQNRDIYHAALVSLANRGKIYSCTCTRTRIAAAIASAPHREDHELRYPGTCRPSAPKRIELDDEAASWRFLVPAGEQQFRDEFAGDFVEETQLVVGDFRVAGVGATPSYQLAVVVDDAQQNVDRIVRGDDLLSSTPRQKLIRVALGLQPEPQYWHVPLVIGPDGRRLAKRHGDTRLSAYRELDIAPERVIGLLAEWCGCGERREMSAPEFLDVFDIERVPKLPIVMQPGDDDWLTGSSM